MKRSLVSLVVIAAVSSSAFLLANAFFSDTETSSGNLFQAGAIDLKIDNDSYYNWLYCNPDTKVWEIDPQHPAILNFDLYMTGLIGQPCASSWAAKDLETGDLFFNFQDLKPGDWGEDTISLVVQDNDAWACMDMSITSENMGANDIALSETIKFVWWADDGDNVLEDDEYESLVFAQGPASQVLNASYALADAQTNIWNPQQPATPLKGTETYYIAKAWCLGNLITQPVDQDGESDGSINHPQINPGITCDGQLVSNDSQAGKLMMDISFTAIQSRNNPGYLCRGPISCEIEQVYTALSDVAWFNQGLRKDGTAVLPERSDPTKATGAPEGIITPPSFISLGFGGNIILGFSGPVGNGPGYDLILHEITGGRASYPEEKAKVEVSQNLGGPWFEIGIASSKDADGKSYLDISTGAPHLTYIQYIRVTDISDPTPFEATADGYDLDAIEARYGACTEPTNNLAN